MNHWVFQYIVFPGFIFTAVAGMLASWIDRKVTARVQWRQGPPILQPVYDFVKLMGKETIVPEGSHRAVFLLAPVVGLAGITAVGTMLGVAMLDHGSAFVGDLIVVVYVMTIPSLAVIIGGFASANPLASVGASREMKLVLAYELPFVLAILVPVIKAGAARGEMTIVLGELLAAQAGRPFIFHLSGLLAFLVAVLCMQAKLALVPFDAPEAETEIMGGALIEYSGVALGIHKLTRWMMLVVVPMLLVVLFCGGIGSGWGILTGILKYVGLLVVVVLLRNTGPRVRIDQALRFFWTKVLAVAVLAVVLALVGL